MSGAVAPFWMRCPPSPPSRGDWLWLPCAGEKRCRDALSKGYLQPHTLFTNRTVLISVICIVLSTTCVLKYTKYYLSVFQGAFSGWTVMLNIDQNRESGFRRLLQSGRAKVAACLFFCVKSNIFCPLVIAITLFKSRQIANCLSEIREFL